MQTEKLKIGAIIQARMGSSRLPGKVLMPIPFPHGKPLLQWIFDGVSNSSLLSSTAVATSTGAENDVLEAYATERGVYCFRGMEDDVLSRFANVASTQQLDIIVRLTADNAFLDTKLLDACLEEHIRNGNDYTKTSGLPNGLMLEITSAKALLQLAGEAGLSPADREHVTWNFRTQKRWRTQDIVLFSGKGYDKLRLTVDYPADLATVSLLLSQLLPGEAPGMSFVERIYGQPDLQWIFAINEGCEQKKP